MEDGPDRTMRVKSWDGVCGNPKEICPEKENEKLVAKSVEVFARQTLFCGSFCKVEIPKTWCKAKQKAEQSR